jgi:hypothetical protein
MKMWSHLNEALDQAKLFYGDRNQNNAAFWVGGTDQEKGYR